MFFVLCLFCFYFVARKRYAIIAIKKNDKTKIQKYKNTQKKSVFFVFQIFFQRRMHANTLSHTEKKTDV